MAMKTYSFNTIINFEDPWYVARCIELGVVSQGKTIEEAQHNLKEAVELYLEDVPRPEQYFSKKAPFVTTLEVQHA